MAAWTIIHFANLHRGLDFDAEHYHPERLAAWKALAKGTKQTVNHFVAEVDELEDPNPAFPSFDLTSAINQFLDNEGKIGATSIKKIAKSGDVLVSRLRSYLLEVCLVPKRGKGFSPQISTEFIVFRSHTNHSNAWLVPFILSDPVQTVLRWSQNGSNHPRFNAETLLQIPVKGAVINLFNELNTLTESATREYESSAVSYPEAEAELLERIEWNKLREQSTKLTYICDFSKLTANKRSDAEFFQPQYARLARKLLSAGAKDIGSFCPKPTRGVQPEIIAGGNVVVVDSKAVRPLGVEPATEERTSTEFRDNPTNAKGRVSYGDVLLNSTGRGTLGRAACYQLKAPAICDNHVAILRPDPNICNPGYLALFLNSPAGLAQSEQFQTGSSGQLEIYPEHIKKFLVYLPRNKNGGIDIEWQKKLAAKVVAANAAKTAARAKLDQAKQLVEAALNS